MQEALSNTYMQEALSKIHKANSLVSIDARYPWLMDSGRNNEIQKRIKEDTNHKQDPNI